MTTENDPPTVGVGTPKPAIRRLGPLIVVLLVSVGVIAMGWHRQLSFETLVRHHDALRELIAMHEPAAVCAYVVLYAAVIALSIPVGIFLTLVGGILFGAVLGGAAAVIGATVGAISIFLIAKSAVGEHLMRRAGPLAGKLARGFRADAFSYLLFLRLVPVFPFWLINLVPALCSVRLATFVAATVLGIIPARQRDRRAASRLSRLPRGRPHRLPARIQHACGVHAPTPDRARGARPACAHPGRGEADADLESVISRQ
jgi:uncharacterized membrane protein YdjX (TVP38/TMEM64 family)